MTHQLIKKQNFNKLTFFRRGSGSLIGKMRRVGATIKGFGDYRIANNSIMKERNDPSNDYKFSLQRSSNY